MGDPPILSVISVTFSLSIQKDFFDSVVKKFLLRFFAIGERSFSVISCRFLVSALKEKVLPDAVDIRKEVLSMNE